MTNGGRRIATATGVMLADPACIGNAPLETLDSWFDPEYWAARGELAEVHAGRGAAWFVGPATQAWVLRHCRRGGLIAHVSMDRYLWAGETRVRAFAEWRLLELLAARGLPVPIPVAARYQRAGLGYRCDLITRRIADTQSLSEALQSAPLEKQAWRDIGTVIARLHRGGADHGGRDHGGVDHADLNAHNILLGGGAVSVIDFDRGRMRPPGRWRQRNLTRLHRSLTKIVMGLPAGRFTALAWDWFLSGYQSLS
jgi:3-deoxy-D-manno-octulosonic acid kinase